MKKAQFILFFFFLSLLLITRFSPIAYAQSSSNCVFTVIGTLPAGLSPTLPPGCNNTSTNGGNGKLADVLTWAQKIANSEQIGDDGSFYCKMISDINNGDYSAYKRECIDLNGAACGQDICPGRYWCTDLVINAYNLAGFSSVPQDEAVLGMINDWKNASGLRYYDFTDSSNSSTVLPEIQPGFAMMFADNLEIQTGNEHVAIINAISLNTHGDGVIHTYEADSPTPLDGVYPVSDYQIQSYDVNVPIVGFGGI